MSAPTTELGLRDYWRVIARRRWLVFIALFATMIPAVALSVMQEPVYTATAQMLLQSKPGEAIFGTNTAYVDPDRVVQNEIAVLEGQVVYEQLRSDLGLTDTYPPGVNGFALGETDVVGVAVSSNDATTAAFLANAYVTAYGTVKRSQAVDSLTLAGTELQSKISELQKQIDAIDDQLPTATETELAALSTQRSNLADQQALFNNRLDQIQVEAALSSGSAQLVAPAFVPAQPVEPTPVRTAVIALVVGLLLGLGAAFLVDYLDDSIRRPGDLAKLSSQRPLLAVVPVDHPKDYRPVALSRPTDPAVEAYRGLRTTVQFLGLESNTQVVMVTSAMPGEGKTTTASNLAVVLAQTGASVVLVDADLRRPRIAQVFGLSRLRGLTENLLGEPLELTINRIDDHLTVINSGTIPTNPSEMLSGKRMASLVEELRRGYDHVILDCAPTLVVTDALALSRHVDGVLVVAQAGRTSAPQLDEVLSRLDQVSAPVLGLVLNKTKEGGDATYGYAYGYGYGYAATPSKELQPVQVGDTKAAAG